jgi:NitT/TauT family transport system permease protein
MADQALELNLATSGRSMTPALRQRVESLALGTATIALLLVVWELLPHILRVQQGTRLFFTVPSRIFATLWQMFATGTIWAPLGVSASAFAIGLALAISVGLPLGILLGRSATLNAMFDPFVTALNATPRLVFLPLLMLWLGIGLWSKVAVVFTGALFPLLINTHEGVRNADKLLINVRSAPPAGMSRVSSSSRMRCPSSWSGCGSLSAAPFSVSSSPSFSALRPGSVW